MRDRALALLLMTAAGCGGGDAPRSAPGEVAPPQAPAVLDPAPADTTPVTAALTDTALMATVRRGAGSRYSVSGETRAADRLELTLEDGHRILFGPSELEVVDDSFHLEFVAERSDQQVLSVFITSADGARQWVIPVPRDSLQVRFGPQ